MDFKLILFKFLLDRPYLIIESGLKIKQVYN